MDMSRDVGAMDVRSRRGWVTTLLIAAVLSVPLAAGGHPFPLTDEFVGLLPRNFVISLSAVNQFFSEITEQSGTGRDETAVGRPIATRAVFFTNGDGSLKVTITVDRYLRKRDAASAYQQALEKSEAVPGFAPISIPDVGKKAFAGTVTMGGETHIGLGALDGNLVVGATLAGFDATPDNVTNLVGLARAEDAAANAAAGCRCSRRS